MTDEIRARNLMSTVAHLLANAVRTGAYPSFEAFLEAFSTALTARMGIVDSERSRECARGCRHCRSRSAPMGRNHDPLDRRYRSGDHSGRHAREASQRPHGLDVECGSYEREREPWSPTAAHAGSSSRRPAQPSRATVLAVHAPKAFGGSGSGRSAKAGTA